jgi:hypothetical protein
MKKKPQIFAPCYFLCLSLLRNPAKTRLQGFINVVSIMNIKT